MTKAQPHRTLEIDQRPDARFLLLLMPDFALLPFGGMIDKLRFSADDEDYSNQRYCSWTIVGLEGEAVPSSSGVMVQVEQSIDAVGIQSYDYLVVFGGRTVRGTLAMAEQYRGVLKRAAAMGVTLVTIDNGVFMLAACGLLNDYKVAVHWRHLEEFMEEFPRIDARSEQLYCIDRNRVTCAGGAAAIDLTVELLARHCGHSRALKGLPDMLVDESRSHSHRLKSQEHDLNTGGHLGRAIGLMRTLLAEQQTTDQLAAQLGIGRRQLDRLFKQRFGQTAHGYWQEMRLQHVRWRLLNSDHRLSILADEVAIQDTSYLCKLIRKRFGESPQALRKQGVSVDV